ncbi:MAG: glycoside hydrolase family 3 C-terminal domain-containing protein, partial [Oscillospiraceae bacterium]|nr:glycoside hydrolase family 3 C-terminal domain-containing protein [Oscillospiraceae bacterium]
AIGAEARALGLSCVLGPGINIKRSPLCGRNFEYFSEDPLLSGRMGAGVVNGLQSQGVAACLKHFAANNQEDYRFWVDVRADERTLREIYLASFEYALMFSKPKVFMCSYNKINGQFASENRWLLTEVLRDGWGYDGIVMSDWGAVNSRPQGVWAGLDLEMPGSFGVNDAEVLKSVRGEDTAIATTDPDFTQLTEAEIDLATERMLNFILDLEESTSGTVPIVSHKENHKLAREIAAESMVLLENSGGILPLKRGEKVAVVGDLATNPVYQGGGSSRIVPTKVDIPFDCIAEYAQIIPLEKAKTVIVFAGTPDGYDTEGTDRTSLDLPAEQYKLLLELQAQGKNIVLVICAGAPVHIPFGFASAVLLAYYGGQAMGGAVADLLFGVKNPCGKLAETFPHELKHTPCYGNFPGDGVSVTYAEGTLVGYRWYNNWGIGVNYPFGYGLSYTTFEYGEWAVSGNQATVTVTNTGDYDGKEIVQYYDSNGELRGFKKVFLAKGESKTVTVDIIPKAGQITQSPVVPKVTLYTQVKALWKIPNGRELLDEIGAKFGVEVTEELVNTRDCSSFVGNMLRNMVTMFDLGWSFADLQARIDRINEMNGL